MNVQHYLQAKLSQSLLFNNRFIRAALFINLLLFAHSALAAGNRINFGADTWLEAGAGIRFDWTSIEDAAPNADDFSDDFTLDRADIFISGRANRFLEFTLNTTYNSITEDFEVREGIIRYEHSDTLNIWAGRFMVPTDLSSLSTVFYQTRWFPVLGAFQRDEGVALWGSLDEGSFQYSLGVFDGFEIDPPADAEESPLFAGRFRVNFWDPVSGYYTQSTYYGEKNILSVGVSAEFQSDAFEGLLGEVGDFQGVSADVLLEKAIDDGMVLTVQGTAFSYDTDDIDGVFPQSDGFEIMGAVLLPVLSGDSVGGRVQPTVSLQSLELDVSDIEIDRIEFGINYIMLGHDTKLSAAFANSDIDTPAGSDDFISFLAGVQLIF